MSPKCSVRWEHCQGDKFIHSNINKKMRSENERVKERESLDSKVYNSVCGQCSSVLFFPLLVNYH